MMKFHFFALTLIVLSKDDYSHLTVCAYGKRVSLSLSPFCISLPLFFRALKEPSHVNIPYGHKLVLSKDDYSHLIVFSYG